MSNSGTPPPTAGRTFDIEVGGHEIITIDLDNLDPDANDLVELLKERQYSAWIWSKLASEYWRSGHLKEAERIAQSAVDTLTIQGDSGSLAPIHCILANMCVARGNNAPKVILENAREDILASEKQREEHFKEAAGYFNKVTAGTALAVLTRGVLQVATRNLDEALRTFDSLLEISPNNTIALLGKAKILYARRQFPLALKLFQNVLRLNPNCTPDPRIGIGLCLWAMDYKDKARAAWQRSVEVNPSVSSARLLLGLEALNSSKNVNQTEEERSQQIITGTRLIEAAFKSNQRNSAAASALSQLLLQKSQYKRAMKLAERAIQFADVKSLLTDGHIRAGRIARALYSNFEATRHFTRAKEGSPHNVLANIGLAQLQMENDELPAAIHTLDSLLQQVPAAQRSIEATAMLASLRAHPRPGMSASDQAQEKVRARELFDYVCKALHLPEDLHASQSNGHALTLSGTAQRLAEDVDLHTEIAQLWQGENNDRMERALKEALRLSEAHGQPDPRLVNDLAVLQHFDGKLDDARELYERALTHAAGLSQEAADGMSTTILYNLARVYEQDGKTTQATDAFEKLLDRHPEYADAKVRQAQMLADLNHNNEAHELLKQSLSSQPANLNLRAYYTYFLIQSNLSKLAKDFVFITLKDHDKHDVYSLCAAGWIQYHQARESRDASTKGIDDRRKGFVRAAEFYEKALQLDPMCAIAAQGLAIVTAEDALGTLGGSLGLYAADEGQKRVKNSRDALDIFAKVRESLNDGSVYINMGHCYYARDEFDKAIESYETASKRFYHGQDVPTLLYLCRAWYAKANKDQSFSAMNTALQYGQKAYHLHPSAKDILYNIAMIQQKAAEMLISVQPAKRTLKDLQRAIAQAGHAQKLFASLAADPSPSVSYNREIADQRRKYGDSMLRRSEDHLATQRQWEDEAQAKVEAARQRRLAEKERQEALERERQEERRVQAEKLGEERRIAREQALEWTREVKELSDEERERKAKKGGRRVKREPVSGDEEVADVGEPKRRRRTKVKRENGDGEEALFSGDEEDSKPVKKRQTKKRAIRDDDDDEPTGAPRKKQIKSKEYISDSDEEMS